MYHSEVSQQKTETVSGGREVWAYRLIIIISTAALYIDLDLFSIGGVVISVHKLIALIGFPVAIALMGIKKLKIDMRIVIFGLLMFVTFCLFYIISGTFDNRFFSALVQVGLNGAVAVLLFTALTNDPKAFRFFIHLIIAFSVISAVISILQVFGISTGTLKVPDTIPRVSGLLKDPNYQAAALLIGIACLLSLEKINFRIPFILILSAGVVCTVSRMGLLVLGLLILISPVFFRHHYKKRVVIFMLWMIIGGVVVVLLFFPLGLGETITGRFSVLLDAFKQIASTQGESLLQIARLKLAYNAFLGFLQHPLLGIGVFNSTDFMIESMGITIALHNTYMEFILAGGVWGILLLVYLYSTFVRACCISPDDKGGTVVLSVRHTVILFGLVYILVSFFLSYHLDITTWLLLIFSIYYRDLAEGGVPMLRWQRLRGV